MARREIDEKTKRRRPDIGDGRIYGNPVDAFLSTIEETIPQVLKASSLSTLSSSPCSPRGCTLSSVQLSFLPRGENDPSSPPPLPLHSRPCRGRISIGRKKSHLTIVKRGASLAARETKSGGGKWEGGREGGRRAISTCSRYPLLASSGILFPRADPTSRSFPTSPPSTPGRDVVAERVY